MWMMKVHTNQAALIIPRATIVSMGHPPFTDCAGRPRTGSHTRDSDSGSRSAGWARRACRSPGRSGQGPTVSAAILARPLVGVPGVLIPSPPASSGPTFPRWFRLALALSWPRAQLRERRENPRRSSLGIRNERSPTGYSASPPPASRRAGPPTPAPHSRESRQPPGPRPGCLAGWPRAASATPRPPRPARRLRWGFRRQLCRILCQPDYPVSVSHCRASRSWNRFESLRRYWGRQSPRLAGFSYVLPAARLPASHRRPGRATACLSLLYSTCGRWVWGAEGFPPGGIHPITGSEAC